MPFLAPPLIRSAVLTAIVWSAIPSLQAEEAPIRIMADHLSVDTQKGVARYTGHVKATQGTKTLQCQNATVIQTQRASAKPGTASSPASSLDRIEALAGNEAPLVVYHDTGTSPPVQGTARKIVYYAQKHILEMQGDAMVKQGAHTIQSERIVYNTADKSITVPEKNTTATHVWITPPAALE